MNKRLFGRANHAIAPCEIACTQLAANQEPTTRHSNPCHRHACAHGLFRKKSSKLCNKKPALTVLGGSQGAGVLGDLVPDAIAMIETYCGQK